MRNCVAWRSPLLFTHMRPVAHIIVYHLNRIPYGSMNFATILMADEMDEIQDRAPRAHTHN